MSTNTQEGWIEAFTRKPRLEQSSTATGSQASSLNAEGATLKRTLNTKDLLFYGVGCSVGAGIYSLVGIGADLAGPAIAASFLLCGLACIFTSLSYAEFAARIPLAGSAYTFCYVAFGELCAWLVGWNLTLGYAISAAVVARSWAEYVSIFFQMSHWWTRGFGMVECCPLAAVIIGLCTLVLVTGVKESAQFNTVMTILNLVVLALVILVGATSVDVESHWTPFAPKGVEGVAKGAGLVFFSYLGFDMVACLSEEVEHPEITMPVGIIGSLLISMSVYVSVSLVVVGMVPLAYLGPDVPLTNAFLANACCNPREQQLHLEGGTMVNCLDATCAPMHHPSFYYISRLISFAAMFGLTTATFTCLMGQPRVFYRMAQDGLLFPIYAKVNEKTGIPTFGTVVTGIVTAAAACFIDLETLANAISLGTLQVFSFVNAGVLLLRVQKDPYQELHSTGTLTAFWKNLSHNPQTKSMVLMLTMVILTILVAEGTGHQYSCWIGIISCTYFLFNLPRERPPSTFQCPCVPFVPLAGMFINSYMMGSFGTRTWIMVLLWVVAGVVVYLGYGMQHSKLSRMQTRQNIDLVSAPLLSPSSSHSQNYASSLMS